MEPSPTDQPATMAGNVADPSRTPGLSSRQDYTAHAIGTAVLGLAVAALMILTRGMESNWQIFGINVLFIAATLAVIRWLDSSTRTVPRHVTRSSTIGLAGSMFVALAIAIPVLNWSERTQPLSTVSQILAVVAVATPCWIMAAAIAKRRS